MHVKTRKNAQNPRNKAYTSTLKFVIILRRGIFMIKILDLFSGIGGFSDAALTSGYDIEHTGLCEIDKQCQEVLKLKYPGVTIYSDVSVLDATNMSYDLLFSGFPCQSFSRNGKFYNKNNKTIPDGDVRANLFLQIVRILHESQPKAFLLENVKELQTIKNEQGELFFDIILEELNNCGYNVTTKVLCPSDFNVPQQRKRVFLVGIRKDLSYRFEFPNPEPLTTCALDYMDDKVDQRYYLENLWRNRYLLKDPATSRLEALKAAHASNTWASGGDSISQSITPLAIIYGDTPSGLPRQQDKLYSVKGISPTIATFSTPAYNHPSGWRVLTPRECFRLQSFSEGHPIIHKDSAAYKQAGNAVNVVVVRKILEKLIPCIV